MNKREKARSEGGVFNIFMSDSRKDSSTNLEDTGLLTNGLKGNFVMTPRIGPRELGITATVHQPGQGMQPHIHPLSGETLIAFKGNGSFYLKDRWIPVKEGDVVHAPAGVKHGSTNPETNTEIFITVGIGTPPQADLYSRANYDPNGDDEDYITETHSHE